MHGVDGAKIKSHGVEQSAMKVPTGMLRQFDLSRVGGDASAFEALSGRRQWPAFHSIDDPGNLRAHER